MSSLAPIRSEVETQIDCLARKVVAHGVGVAIDAIDRLHEAASRDPDNFEPFLTLADAIRRRLGMPQLLVHRTISPNRRLTVAEQYETILGAFERLRAERDELLARLGEK